MLRGEARGFQTIAAIGLVWLLAMPPQSNAQAPNAQQPPALNPAGAPPAEPPAPLPVESLRVLILVGEGAINDIRTRTTASPVVEIRDENGIPAEGAQVVFELPVVGAGGLFAGQQYTATVKTNSQGQATVTYQPNMQTGRFNIKVAATLGNRSGHGVIRQSNALRAAATEKEGGGLFKFAWWKVVVVAGVAATIGVLLATRGGSSGPSVNLIPGTPTFGAP